MRILFWVPYPKEGASNRYRVEQYLPYLKKAGIKYSLHPFWMSFAFRVLFKKGHFYRKIYFFILGTLFRIFDLVQIFRYDIVFIHREAYPIDGAFFETILSMLKKPFIFDFDDAIFLPTSSRRNNFVERFKRPDKIANIIKMSSHVIAGNRYLSEFAFRYNHSVSIIPTSIDTDNYHPVDKPDTDEVVIGWIGSITTSDFLNAMKYIFISLSKLSPHIRFKIVGGNLCINGLSNITNKPWTLKDELGDLTTFDIGIMPMPDNQWTRGKCAFKAILYMSVGIPCICSPVGMNKEIIQDGINGFLADSQKVWIEKMSLLIEDPDLRRKMGRAGRKTVEEKFSITVNAPRYLEILKEVFKKT